MGSSKSSSSDESDGKKARKRSYECTFCKRGFTNAQALGGHMNIHRKDRAKTKQLTSGSSSSLVTLKHEVNPSFAGRARSGQTMELYPGFEGRRYLQEENIVHGSDENGLVRDRGNVQGDEQVWGENLSLRVGSNKTGEVEKEDELDLELRLGHDRYSR